MAPIWLAGQPPHGFSSSAQLTVAAQHQDLPAPTARALVRWMAEKTEVGSLRKRGTLVDESRQLAVENLGGKGSSQSVSHLKRNTMSWSDGGRSTQIRQRGC